MYSVEWKFARKEEEHKYDFSQPALKKIVHSKSQLSHAPKIPSGVSARGCLVPHLTSPENDVDGRIIGSTCQNAVR